MMLFEDDHINSARATLNRNLLAIRRSTSANQMVSALTTNFYLRYPPIDSNSTKSLKMSPRVFNGCSCLNVEGSLLINSVNKGCIYE
jgi:hypothetical protein